MSLVPSGILAVFKPRGFTSNDVVQVVKKILNNAPKISSSSKPNSSIKVGHGGTLDPLAEGVLVLGIGKGTKSLSNYLSGSKAYVATGVFGVQTDSLDCTGKTLSSKSWKHIKATTIEKLLQEKYIRSFAQVPPMYSALKKDGVALYKLAREGIQVEREARLVTIYRSQLFRPNEVATSLILDCNTPTSQDLWKGLELPHFRMEVECSGGFYIRSLIDDIGKDCDSFAHMTELVRIKQGSFTIADSVPRSDWNIDRLIQEIIKCNAKVDFKE